ncbi:MAG: hypothetical protein LGR52_13630 [Candidatus Thiosymbion ectosymbiont of Robbea hypermnestra]|nr:hypothetical protein [Candidatus Thiosymbion ectosymbiont of Robbea hypermnestra]
MSTERRPSSFAWFMVHIAFPLVPFLIEGVIRYLVFDASVSWTTFSSATLAMSSGLLCLFVSQSLLTHQPITLSEQETERMIGMVYAFSILAIVSFVLFGAVVLLSALIEKASLNGFSEIKAEFDSFILVGSSVSILLSIYAQRSFKLRTAV